MASSLLLASSPMLPGDKEEPSRHLGPLPSPAPAVTLTHGRPKPCPSQQHPSDVSDDSVLLLKPGDDHKSQDHDADLVPIDTYSPLLTGSSRMHNPVPPSHLMPNLTAMPLNFMLPPNPCYMDISPVSVNRCAHSVNEPTGVSPGTRYQPLCEDGLGSSMSIEYCRESRESRDNSPMLEASVGDMDLDSPSYNPYQIANNSGSGGQSPAGSASPFKQHSGRSASEGSIGKRSRMDEDDGYQHSSSYSDSERSSCRHRLSLSSTSESVEGHFSPSPPHIGSSNNQIKSSNLDMNPFSPEPLSSSSFEDASPCLNAVARKGLHQAPSDSPISAFRFPAEKSIRNFDKSSNIKRQPRSSTSSSRSDSAPSRSKSKVAQNSATLFNRHLSLSTTLDVSRLEKTTNLRGVKNPRALSLAASRTSDLEDRENSEEPDEADFSPVPQISVKQISATCNPNPKGKRCAAPLDLDYLQPPPLHSTNTLQSPSSTLFFTFGATIQSPVGIAFSEKERAGKILPCHKVSSDGLMRISPETMDKFLEGAYDDRISKKMIIDCRFGYEFDAGHIREAINLHDKEDAETMLLQGALFNGGNRDVPIPSESGKPDPNGETKKVVLVFHCEYSAMRAPTVAKHLREQDRHKNMTHYPALHYPEIYILEGGFAKYHSHSPQHCNGSYVRMDDPTHRADRQADLNLFRTRQSSLFTKTKSYTYGDSKTAKHKKGSKLTLGAARFGLESNSSISMTGETNENSPTCSKMTEEEDDEDIESYAQASSPLYMTITAATHAKRANLKTQGRSISMLAKVEQGSPSGAAEAKKSFGSV
ncbi:cell division cycle- protein [Puccinia graminis f. sp. tritici]|uniref:M-phase inducer phosphatase n=1 Tax=Puccinia graminis f. sp. tritici TaxID=56615 RepID=A0A5B0NAI0_PUCGR|nr:cell division cycle- protein [Puccinia graminis f. sp. tritici]